VAAARREAKRLIDLWLATDEEGNEHALARRRPQLGRRAQAHVVLEALIATTMGGWPARTVTRR
jgi:hypothetical protein